ncbi:MAG: hypothetical protein AAGC60_14805 [Acidobacteriota bacterium]
MSSDHPFNTARDTPFEAPARRYDDGQLARLLEISSAVDCECPNHLAQLVSRLVAFETYSRDCESQNAEDAAVHAYLYRRTAAAREVMEEALEELVRFEQIEI